MRKILFFIAVHLAIVLSAAAHIPSNLQDSLTKKNTGCNGAIKHIYPPAVPSTKFLNIYGDNDLAITSFVATCSRLREASVWLHEESGGLIGAHIVKGGPYGQVIAVGNVTGQSVGKQRIQFTNNIYLQKNETYYLKLFKGEPATARGSTAAAAKNSDLIQGYHMYGPVSSDLAHELVFDEWEGSPPANIKLDDPKSLTTKYKESIKQALLSKTDLFGEEVLKLPEGPTYENTKDYIVPLKLMGTAVTESGVYYIPFGRPVNTAGYGPVALHVGDGSQVISQTSTGAKTTVFVGAEGEERYGLAEARLEQESLEDGYQPVLINGYKDRNGVKYIQESFSDYTYGTTELVSFIKIRISKENATINSVKLVLVFSDNELSLEGGVLKFGDKVRALVPAGGKLIDKNRLSFDVDLNKGDQEFYFARLLHPSECLPREMNAQFHDAEKAELKAYWSGELAKGASFEVPEERVNNARKGLLIQNLYMGYLYSIGNRYQTWYQPEGNDAARILGEYGFMPQQRAIHDVLLSVPFRRYRTWEIGELLSHSAQYFHMSKDTAFVRQHEQRFIGYMEDLEKQMNASPNGVLTAEAFSGDIAEKLVYLHHQAVAWRGMRDMAFILKLLGNISQGEKYIALAASLGRRLSDGLNASKTVMTDNSIFLPTELFTAKKPEPYPQITETKYGSYWNLCFPYAAASGILSDELMSGYYNYIKNYGGLLLGMVRFNYYPVPVGDFRRDGLPGYKTTGVDNVYGLNISRVMARLDDPDRMVLSLYGKLAHGMTRDTYVSGEGDTVGPYPDEYYRTFYLSPSSFNNSWFLLMLRLMLIAETEGENGVAQKLHLAYSTPRAWMEQGKQIKVADAPTPFGKLGFVINSDINNRKMTATVSLPFNSESIPEISIRLRTPGKKQIKSVRINGAAHKAFDANNETINLTGKKGVVKLSVTYY